MIPVMQLAEHDDPGARPALVAIIRSRPIAIVEPVAILAATERARAMLVDQEAWIDPDQGQDFAPAAADQRTIRQR